MSIILELPGEQGYRPIDEWQVSGRGNFRMSMELSLLHKADAPEFDHAIQMLRAHGVLPGSGQ